jgi:hypothetical protein
MEETQLTVQSPEKVTLYLDFIEMFTKILDAAKSKKDTKRLGAKMISIGLRMMILAPDDVAEAYKYWKALASEGGKSETLIDAFGIVIIEMRKDLIEGTTSLSPDDAIGVFLKDQL